MNKWIITALMGFSIGVIPLYAQPRLLSEQEAIVLALQNHPALAAAEGAVKQQALLRNAGPNWEASQIFHNVTADPDLGLLGTLTLGVQQSFPSAKVTKAYQGFYGGLQQQAEAERSLSKQDITRQVRELYHHLSFLQAKASLYHRLDSVYSRVAQAATNRYQVGDIPLSEKLALQDKARQIQLERQSVGHEIEFDHYVLARLLGTSEPVLPQVEPLHAGHFSLADTSALANSALATLGQSRVVVAQWAQNLQQARFAPTLSAGVYGQYLGDGQFFPGWQLGLNIPLFRKALHAQADAATLGVVIAEASRRQNLLEQQSAMGHLLHQQERHLLLLAYYEAEGKTLAAELMRSGELNYRSGELSYADLVQLLEQSARIELDYLQNLLGLNQTIIGLEALTGSAQ